MNCPESLQLLQHRLDGESLADGSGLGQHLAACLACRELHAAAGRLEAGLRTRARPALPPPGLADLIVAGVLQDRQARAHRRRRLLVGAVAAALLLTAGLGYYRWQQAGPAPALRNPDVAQQELPVNPPPAGPSLDQDVEEARAALAELTRRAAGETLDQSRRLLADMSPAARSEDVVRQPAEPPTQSLREAGQGVSTGLEPMADSARRAVNLFLRDFQPLGPERNPGL